MSKKLLLMWLTISFCLVLLPTLLVRGCDWAAPAPAVDWGELGPALPIDIYIEEEGRTVRMDLEDYVKGVVMAEMPASFHLEALKAQAVAARTYAVLRMRVFGGAGSERHPDADISTNSDHAQAFASASAMSWGSQSARYASLIERAVHETAGLIAVYDDYPLDAVYHSTCGGHTEASGDVWQRSVPYLVSVECGYCSHSPHFRSTRSLLVSEVSRLLGISLVTAGQAPFTIAERSATGRVRSVSTPSETMRGLDFRSKLELPSTHFAYEQRGDHYYFQLQGWGHGVGMCQYGADGLARSGRGYVEILAQYYTGTTVRPIFYE